MPRWEKEPTALSNKFFHDGDPYHIETSPLICSTNQWAGFYTERTSVMKDLNYTLWESKTMSKLFRVISTDVYSEI